MHTKLYVLIAGVVLSHATYAEERDEQWMNGGSRVTPVQSFAETRKNVKEGESSSAAALQQTLEHTLWELDTKALRLENEQRRLDELVEKAERIGSDLGQIAKGGKDVVDVFNWGSSITMNILTIVLGAWALLFAGGLFGLYRVIYAMLSSNIEKDHERLRSQLEDHNRKLTDDARKTVDKTVELKIEEDHRRLVSQLEDHNKKLTEEAKFKVHAGMYHQLTVAYYQQYRWLFGYEEIKPEYVGIVELATYFAHLALENMKSIADDYPGKQDLLLNVEQAKFYHLGALPRRLRGPHANAAIQFALEKLPNIVEKHREAKLDDWYYKEETRCWILLRFGDADQQERASADIKALLRDESIPAAFLKEVRGNYERIGIAVG